MLSSTIRILLNDISTLVCVARAGELYKTGENMNNIRVIEDAAMLIEDDIIAWVGTAEEARQKLNDMEFIVDDVIGYEGKTILPGLVDSHTHAVFAGNRADEFARRLRGATYAQIAQEGGGILATMNAVRESSAEHLAQLALPLLIEAMRHGTTTIEIKSGYGLSMEAELQQLRAIRLLQAELPLNIIPTFMAAHAIPPEYRHDAASYVKHICEDMLPVVAEESLAQYCDVFIEEGYFNVEQAEKILLTALRYGIQPRVHVDEFSSMGGVPFAVKIGAHSADHLLRTTDEDITLLGKSDVVATMLPGTAFFLAEPYAPVRKFIDAGAVVAIATDCNPGSSFCNNMQMILAIACHQMKMTVEEAISAATINAAYSLRKSSSIGSLEEGKKADFIVMNKPLYPELVYQFGVNHVQEVWINGRREIINY